jgi:subtilisin family serine protease
MTLLTALSIATALVLAPSVVTTNDPLADQQYSLTQMSLSTAWATTRGAGIVIAIVDTGVDSTHSDLADRLVAGIDLVDGDTAPDDPNGHGTYVAGIAAATANNGVGIAGAAPEASIMPVRVLDAAGSGSDETVAQGIVWAVDHGADVINLSLGESGLLSRLSKGGPVNAAIRYADAAGSLVVAAAGNESNIERAYRLGVPVVVVGAAAAAGQPATFTNMGDPRAVVASGVDIVSTAPTSPTKLFPEGTDGYASLDGTSMAAPAVAGVAALLMSLGVTATTARETIAATASNPDGDLRLGAGVVNAETAVASAVDVASPSVAPVPVTSVPTPAASPPSSSPPLPTATPSPSSLPPSPPPTSVEVPGASRPTPVLDRVREIAERRERSSEGVGASVIGTGALVGLGLVAVGVGIARSRKGGRGAS